MDFEKYKNEMLEELGNTKLTSTWFGKIFKVEYELRIFVKHDSMTEKGEGNYITVPVRLCQLPYWTKEGEGGPLQY